ncbi:MAG: rod shape-determining protein MreC [Alphaproteobacteria bacterium]|nr:rod shape-determining protein MreC [Alphaproteobacteria bacterium]
MKNRLERLRNIRMFFKRFRTFVYMFLSLVLLFFGVSKTPIIEEIRFRANAFFYPFISTLSQPFIYGKKVLDEVKDLWEIRKDNIRLKQEVKILKTWRAASYRLKEDNTYLSRLLNYIPPKKAKLLTARLVADSGNTYSRSVIVLAGKKQGVNRGDVAMSGEGVLGRVVQVGQEASRVLLLTDLSSKIPVIVGKNRVLSVLSGDNTADPYLEALPEEPDIKVGDRVSSSGHVGVYPSGLAVGVVSEVSKNKIRVHLFGQREKLEFVELVDFGLSSVLIPKEDL